MRRDDPARPDIGPDCPALVWAGKSLNSVLPSVEIEPLVLEEHWLLRAMLPTQFNQYSWHEFECHSSDLPRLLAEFRQDPEEFFTERLGWVYRTTNKPQKLPGITLEDLGL